MRVINPIEENNDSIRFSIHRNLYYINCDIPSLSINILFGVYISKILKVGLFHFIAWNNDISLCYGHEKFSETLNPSLFK